MSWGEGAGGGALGAPGQALGLRGSSGGARASGLSSQASVAPMCLLGAWLPGHWGVQHDAGRGEGSPSAHLQGGRDPARWAAGAP